MRHDQHIHYPRSQCGRTCCVVSRSLCWTLTIDNMQMPAEHVCGLESGPSTHRQHVLSRDKYTNLYRGQPGHGAREKDNASTNAVISAVLLECVLALEKKRHELLW